MLEARPGSRPPGGRCAAVTRIDAIRAGDRKALAKALTLLESARPDHRQAAEALLQAAMPYAGDALRIGVSGAPGVRQIDAD